MWCCLVCKKKVKRRPLMYIYFDRIFQATFLCFFVFCLYIAQWISTQKFLHELNLLFCGYSVTNQFDTVMFENCLYATLRPSGTLLFNGLPMMIWQKNLKRIYVFSDFEKIVKSSCQEGYIKKLTDFFLPRRSSFRKISPKSSYQSRGQTHGLILLNFVLYYTNF